MDDADLRGVLGSLDQEARVTLRVLIRDQADGDAISSQLLRYRDGHGDDWAYIIDVLTLDPEARRKVVRLFAEIEARETPREDNPDEWRKLKRLTRSPQ